MYFDHRSIIKDPLYIKFQAQIEKFSFKENDKVIIAISGGLDSVTLLILLFSCQKYRLVNVHVNHGLHEDADEHSLFVKTISDNLKIPLYVKKLNPKKKNKSISTEEWARLERYSFLNDILEKIDGKYILTAHHGNDQAETLLMNLSRKTGVSGLKGIAKKRGKIIRPMLNITKKEIIDFQNRTSFNFIDDPTNHNISIPRNFLRNKIIQPWEMKYPEIIEGIMKSMQYFSEWETSLDFLIMEYLVPKIIRNKIEFIIPNKLIRKMPITLKIRLIKILTDNRNELWSKHQFQLVNHFLIKNHTGNIFHFSNGWSILHDRGKMIGKKDYYVKNNSTIINPNKIVIINNCEFGIDLKNTIPKVGNQDKLEIIDWSKIKNKKLEIRTWKKGDYFQPLGMNGKQKLSDFLTNEKVDRFSKIAQFVFTADKEIFWVCGKRISNWARVTKGTEETAILTYKSF